MTRAFSSAVVRPMDRTNSGALRVAFSLLRVPDWAKNVFVFAPLIFSARLLNAAALWNTAVVAAALCAFSSSVYILNDLMDMARDREHPTKRHRPLAAGLIAPSTAAGVGIGLVALGCAALLGIGAPASVWGLAIGFLLLNAVYSCYLKRKVIVDILTIAIGYVLRVLAGGAVIGVAVTHWLLLCTFLLATFLGFSKRAHELTLLGAQATQHRPVLSLYSKMFLDQASLLTLAMTLTCYILYTIAPETIERFGTDALVYSSLIVIFGLFRYLFLIHVKQMGSPVEVLYYDRQIVLAVVSWVLYVVAVVYTWPAVAEVIR